MKVLVVTNLYPTERKPQWGMFVKEQVDSLRATFPNELLVDKYLVDGSRSKASYLKGLICLPGVIRSRKYEVVHCHYGLTLLALLFVRTPIVVTFHGSDLLKSPVKHISKALASMAARVIVVSKNLYDELGYGTIIPCGIDTKKFTLQDKFAINSQSKPEIKILFPANPAVKVKNYDLFRDVCMELRRRGRNVIEVHLNNIPREKVPSVYWNCDLMVLTSISEGSPTVIKEAIAAKLPFVSVDVGDVREWAEMVDFGIVEESRDPKRIADKVIELIDRIAERNKLDNRNALEKMDILKTAQKIKKIYDEAVKK